jgi:hypothetical protein
VAVGDRLDIEEGFLLWRDRRVKDVAKAGYVVALLRAVRSVVPKFGEFRPLGDHLVQSVDGARSKVCGQLWQRL